MLARSGRRRRVGLGSGRLALPRPPHLPTPQRLPLSPELEEVRNRFSKQAEVACGCSGNFYHWTNDITGPTEIKLKHRTQAKVQTILPPCGRRQNATLSKPSLDLCLPAEQSRVSEAEQNSTRLWDGLQRARVPSALAPRAKGASRAGCPLPPPALR